MIFSPVGHWLLGVALRRAVSCVVKDDILVSLPLFAYCSLLCCQIRHFGQFAFTWSLLCCVVYLSVLWRILNFKFYRNEESQHSTPAVNLCSLFLFVLHSWPRRLCNSAMCILSRISEQVWFMGVSRTFKNS